MIFYARILLFVGFCFNRASAQMQAVYLSVEEYFEDKQHMLSLTSKIKTLGFNIHNCQLKLVQPDTLINCKDVFVFSDIENNNYRLLAGKWMQCLQLSTELQLYKTESAALQGKAITTSYYFSRDFSSQLFPLTIDNLLNVFADDLAFCLLLELYYNADDTLLEYDQLHNTYKVCRLRQLSKQVLLKN